MQWTKHKIEVKDLDTFCDTYIKIVKKGDPALEHFYCVFLAPNNNIICMCSIFYFLDLYAQQVVTKETVTKLYTYQVLNS